MANTAIADSYLSRAVMIRLTATRIQGAASVQIGCSCNMSCPSKVLHKLDINWTTDFHFSNDLASCSFALAIACENVCIVTCIRSKDLTKKAIRMESLRHFCSCTTFQLPY